MKDTVCGLFATKLPGRHVGVDASMVAILLVLTFGWVGSAGEFLAFGLPVLAR